MISEEMQAVVLDLLRQWRSVGKCGTRRKYSQRIIAKITGISRGSVAAIKKRGYVRPVRKQMPYPKSGEPPEIERCGRCETMALAHEPCQICKLRRLHKHIQPVAHPPSDITLELRPAEQLRYERLRVWQAEQRAITTERLDWQPVPDLDLP